METTSPLPKEVDLGWSFTPEQEEVLMRRSLDMVRTASASRTVIFLDKSARPLSQLFRRIYPKIYPGQPLPRIIYINLGTEKIPVLESFFNRNIDGNEFSHYLQTVDDIKKIYGEDSVAQLQKMLSSLSKEKRLVIDDTYQTGDTSRLANVIISRIDPNNDYGFFPFLASAKDKAKFPGKRSASITAFPWHGTQTGVATPPIIAKLFTSQGPQKRQNALENRAVRKKLDEVAARAINQFKRAA